MTNYDPTRWDKYFIEMARFVSSKSKDPSTQHGCVVVYPDKGICSTGFNGFPRAVAEKDPARWERPMKYKFCEHAERNAIYNAAAHGHCTKGCFIYVTGWPCADCARGIIQCGIHRVYMDMREMSPEYMERWAEDIKVSETMFAEAFVTVYEIGDLSGV